METVAAFFSSHIGHIYFVYGLAFFTMGLAVTLESARSSDLPLARPMWYLGLFGLAHGASEWAEMFNRLNVAAGISTFAGDLVEVALLVISFTLLLVFAAKLAETAGWGKPDPYLVLPILPSLFGIGTGLLRFVLADPEVWLAQVEVLGRYVLGLPASLMAFWALLLQRRAFNRQGLQGFGRYLTGAAVSFAAYAILDQVIAGSTPFFPGSVINAANFLRLFGVPVQLFRALTAMAMAFFFIRLLRVFEHEQRRQLDQANAERLAAQEQALVAQQRARHETEALNRELEQAARELSVLFETCRILGTTLDLDTLLKEAISKITHTLEPVAGGMVLLFDPVRHALDVKVVDPEAEFRKQWPQAQAIAEEAFQSGQTVIYSPDNGQGDGTATDGPLRLIGMPLFAKSGCIGSLCLKTRSDYPHLSPTDMPLIETLAGQLAIAVENAQLYRTVQAKEELRGQLLERLVTAQEEERKRIARELHDDTGQTLTALSLGLGGLEESLAVNPAQARARLAELQSLTARAIDDLYQLIADLRPTLLDDLGLVAALRWIAKRYAERLAISIQVDIIGEKRRLTPYIETILFRVAQEALNNVARHAQAKNVEIRLIFGQGTVTLRISDNGVGFDPEAVLGESLHRKAWGLLGIQERVTLSGGRCQIDSAPGQGTRLNVQVPVSPAEVKHVEDSRVAGG